MTMKSTAGIGALSDVVNRADVWMRECGDRPRFAFEARAERRVGGGGFWQDLHRDSSPEAPVAGFVDLTHPARAKRTDDFVRTESSSKLERHNLRESGLYSASRGIKTKRVGLST